MACAFGGIFIGKNPAGEDILMVCNLCEGDPQCVKNCRLNALVYE
jgi:Fe-S-cluster-containing hydrogenase component 2